MDESGAAPCITTEIVQLGTLPQSLFDDAMTKIAPYIVGFCKRETTSTGSYPVLLGSGTLVRVADRFAILTAEHVLRGLPRDGRLGLLLKPSRHDFNVDTAGLSYMPIARGLVDPDGPDLGALVLSPSIAASIGASKEFWNLSKHRNKMLESPPEINHGFWFPGGFPESEKTIEDDEDGRGKVVRYMHFCGPGGPDREWTNGEHDYFRFPVMPPDLPGIPRDFGGMSGGGLWQFQFRRDPERNYSIVQVHFSGVIYYQVREPDCVALLCHGRRSIYGVAHDRLASAT